MPGQKLTKKTIDTTPLPPNGPTRLHDSGVSGLHLRSTKGGTRTWYVTYRSVSKHQRDYKIGRYPALSPEAARSRALQVLARVEAGEDPAEERKAQRRADTISDLCDRFMQDHVRKKLKKNTIRSYEPIIEKVIKPQLGAVAVDSLTTKDVQRLHSAMAETPRAANLTIRILSSMINMAIALGLRSDEKNPAKGTRLYKENHRNRYLTKTEFQRLWRTLEAEEAAETSGDAPLAIWLLLMTGRRQGEVLALTWGQLDLDGGRLHLPDSKVGARTFNLAPEVVERLKKVKASRGDAASDNAFVIRGRNKDGPLINIQKPWQRIRKKAGIPDVRLHDLRHTYASFAAADGNDLLRIKEMLGHQTIQTTQRYAHLTNEDVRTSVERLGSLLIGLAEHDRVSQRCVQDQASGEH